MTRMISIPRDDLEKAKTLLFDARNLVEAIGLVIEENDDLVFIVQSLARIAVEKIDEVTAGNVIDGMITDEESADMAAVLAAHRATQEGPSNNLHWEHVKCGGSQGDAA